MPKSRRNRKGPPYKKPASGPKTSLLEALAKPIAVAKPQVQLSSESKHTPWPSICKALGTEFRESSQIHGQSGIVHPIAGLGIDEAKNRLVVISADHNPRVAALMRMDVQASFPDFKVLVARPLAVDLPVLARRSFCNADGSLSVAKIISLIKGFNTKEIEKLDHDRVSDTFGKFMERVGWSDLPIKTHAQSLIDQISTVGWPTIEIDGTVSPLDIAFNIINNFSKIDNMLADRESGICPIPTYEFTEEDWELFLSGTKEDNVAQRLRDLDIYQYFFPSKDTFALGLVDRGVRNVQDLIRGADQAQRDGHVFEENKIIGNAADMQEIIQAFKEMGIVAEGEMSWEVANEGKTIRSSVKLRPSEGLISRLSKIVSLKIDVKGIFGS
jgi:hypothetical protein